MNPDRPFRKNLYYLLCTVVCLLTAAIDGHAEDKSLTVATWSGVYGDAQEAAIFKSFTRETGISIRIARYDGDPLALRKAAQPPWDVVDIGRAQLTEGCADGAFQRLDAAVILGTAAVADFIDGTLHPCGIGALIWSQAVAYDATAFAKDPPKTLADFFDVARFPGKRGLSIGAEGTLEVALMADGIPPADVYDVLRRPGGVERALAKLESIRDAIVLWRDGDMPEQLLNEGAVTMTTAYAGGFQRPRQGARRPVGLMFTNQLWYATFWAVPKGVKDAANAFRFISFATDAARLADLSTRLWYGPARSSGFEALPPTMRQELPTARRHFHDALAVDTGYWAEFGAAVDAKYRAWTAGLPIGR